MPATTELGALTRKMLDVRPNPAGPLEDSAVARSGGRNRQKATFYREYAKLLGRYDEGEIDQVDFGTDLRVLKTKHRIRNASYLNSEDNALGAEELAERQEAWARVLVRNGKVAMPKTIDLLIRLDVEATSLREKAERYEQEEDDLIAQGQEGRLDLYDQVGSPFRQDNVVDTSDARRAVRELKGLLSNSPRDVFFVAIDQRVTDVIREADQKEIEVWKKAGFPEEEIQVFPATVPLSEALSL